MSAKWERPRVNRTTRVLSVDPGHPELAALDRAAEVLRAGGLVAFPTETVYGLGADATNPEAVATIYAAKGRPATNPLIVHSHDLAGIRQAVSGWPRAAATLAERFWPGPLTLVLPRSSLIPDAVTAGRDTVGVRIPDCFAALQLLERVGRPVAAPSANRSTGVSPTTARHVLKDLDGRIDLILDAGPSPVGIESTVLDLTTDPPRVLRPGAITSAQIGQVLGVAIDSASTRPVEIGAAISPGQMVVHYAPRTELRLVEPDEIPNSPLGTAVRTGLIVAGRAVPFVPGVFEVRVDWPDPETAARALYATLHEWDERGLGRIDVVLPPDVDAWRAVRDRLWRASRRWSREGRSG
jgi:L-threonylcarbamoyladenylate synthase